MSTYFSKVIKAGDRNREFNFRQLDNNAAPVYSIDVPDDRGNRILFNMQQNKEGAWKTSGQTLPEWILNAEDDLSNAINRHKEE